MKLLLSGLDTVECAYFWRPGGDCLLNFTALAQMKESKKAAKQREPSCVQVGSKEFLLSPNGTASGYPFMMSNPDMSVQFGEFNNPGFFITYRSAALWHKGASALYKDSLEWANGLRLATAQSESLSRVDFAFDFHLPHQDFDSDNFVTVASLDSQHRKDRKAQTYTFGKGDIVLRVYNKSAEIESSSKKTWFYPLWGGVEEDVWRVEFQVRKEVLRRFGIRTFADLNDSAGDVLRFLVTEHTTLRIKGDDSNRSRWALHPLWLMLQEHVATLNTQGVVRVIDAQEAANERLMRLAISLEGYVKRIASLECVRSGANMMSHEQALQSVNGWLKLAHDPLSWFSDVQKRIDQTRLGQW